jgi:hypothetical protein
VSAGEHAHLMLQSASHEAMELSADGHAAAESLELK